MIDRTYCQTMASYNRWMNQKLYAICAELSEEERTRDLGAFFGSVHGTLNHLLFGDIAWLLRFTGQSLAGLKMGEDLHAEFADLRQHRQQTDEVLVNWAGAIAPQWLEQPFEFTSQVDGKVRVLPTWVLVTHLFNHQTHHRGQVTTLLKQLGHDPGVTDLPFLPTLDIYSR